jgi:hypothetical protein
VTTIRRIYAYLLAFAGLAMVSLAAANLAQVLIDVLLGAPLANTDPFVRDAVSLWGATALVGLPVWLLHWLWIQRTARADPGERTSTLRRLFLYAVLGGAVLVMGVSVREMLLKLMNPSAGFASLGAQIDVILRPLPFALVAAVVWLAHWRIAASDRAQVGETGGSATLRRWYTYVAAFVGLLFLLNSARELVEVLWRAIAGGGALTTGAIAQPAADTLVGLGIWLVHWVVVPLRLPEAARRDDGVSLLRSVYLFFALAVGVVGTLLGASQLLYYAVGRLLGVDRPGGVGGDLLQAAAGPGSAVIVYGVAWAYQRQAVRHQAAAFSEAPRQAGIRRLYTYVIALVALSVLTSGVAGLLWTLCDVLFAPGATTGDFWRERVALFATLVIVGLPVWLLHWHPGAGSADEARSLARRLYVYLSLIAAMLTVVAAMAGVVYRLLGLVLGGTFGQDVATDLAHAVALAAVAGLVAVYHWRVLRADARLGQAEFVATEATAVVEIHAADAESLGRALAALRDSGVDVRVVRGTRLPPAAAAASEDTAFAPKGTLEATP